MDRGRSRKSTTFLSSPVSNTCWLTTGVDVDADCILLEMIYVGSRWFSDHVSDPAPLG